MVIKKSHKLHILFDVIILAHVNAEKMFFVVALMRLKKIKYLFLVKKICFFLQF